MCVHVIVCRGVRSKSSSEMHRCANSTCAFDSLKMRCVSACVCACVRVVFVSDSLSGEQLCEKDQPWLCQQSCWVSVSISISWVSFSI